MTGTMIAFVMVVAIARSLASSGGSSWGYTSDDGLLPPERWEEEFPDCGMSMQSPININTAAVIDNDDVPPFDFTEYATECTNCSLKNDGGHTAKVEYTGRQVVLSGGGLPGKYVLAQLHFHWGLNNTVGSEHTIDGHQAPLEMHVVHHNESLSIAEAANTTNGLAVLAFRFQIDDNQINPNLEDIVKHLKDIDHKGEERVLPVLKLSSLLPPTLQSAHFYRYRGSLTTPPCYQSVLWTVFSEPLPVTIDQLAAFRALQAVSEGSPNPRPIANNFRPLQPLNARPVILNIPKDVSDDGDE